MRVQKYEDGELPILTRQVTLEEGVPGDGSPLAGARGVPACSPLFFAPPGGGTKRVSEELPRQQSISINE
jgi:hypothetical protein